MAGAVVLAVLQIRLDDARRSKCATLMHSDRVPIAVIAAGAAHADVSLVCAPDDGLAFGPEEARLE